MWGCPTCSAGEMSEVLLPRRGTLGAWTTQGFPPGAPSKGPTGQDFRTGFNCQTKLNRSEWGMTKMVPHSGDEVAVTISFEGIRM